MRTAMMLWLGAAVVLAGAVTAHAGDHVVLVQNNAFVPADITAAPGETVRWVWVEGFHTVTSGEPCTWDGLFNANVDQFITEFEWTIPKDFPPGVFSYFCLPHCSHGMIGSILIDGAGPIGDLNDDGVVNVSDLLLLLGEWGDCPEGDDCPADLTEDGVVNVSDLLMLLANWG